MCVGKRKLQNMNQVVKIYDHCEDERDRSRQRKICAIRSKKKLREESQCPAEYTEEKEVILARHVR